MADHSAWNRRISLVFYFVFLFAIKKWDLILGREDDDLEAEKKVELASDNYTAIATENPGRLRLKENITSIDNCVTRLRLESERYHCRKRQGNQICREA